MNRLSRWWYGPLTDQPTDLMGGMTVGPGSITVQTLQEAIREAESIARVWASKMIPPHQIQTLVSSSAHQAGVEYTLDSLDQAGEVALNELTVAINDGEMFHCTLRISAKHGAMISGDGMIYDGSLDAANNGAQAILRVLSHETARRTPYYRLPQLLTVSAIVALTASWLWAMLTTNPPAPVWVLSLLLTAAPAWLLWKNGTDRSRAAAAAPRVLTVDTTPREELKARRHNTRQDWKQRLWTASIVGPVGALAGVFFKIWLDR